MGAFRLQTLLPAPPDRCFALSLTVDAHLASMAASGECVIGGVTSGEMTLGDHVTWRAVHFGVPFRMTSTISEYDRPRRFVDHQLRGPFRRFRHEHLFAATGDGATLMTDVLDFRAPFGLLGRLAEWLVLDRYLEKLIRQRNDWLAAALDVS